MRFIASLVVLYLFSFSAVAQDIKNTEHAKKTLEIFKTIVEVNTSKAAGGNTPIVAKYITGELIKAGIPKDDIEIVMTDGMASLIARYRGKKGSTKKPILFLAHMDVVEAYDKDWERPPFQLTQDDTFFYGRGTTDNKFGVAHLTSTFIRLKKEGFVPDRDLIIVFSGDEETEMVTTKMLAYTRSDLQEAEYALNTDGGGGDLDINGKAITYNIQAAEKTYATWEVTAKNPGGHSSRPRPDNAIYDLADAIKAIQGFSFPVRYSDMTKAYFAETGKMLGGALGQAMVNFAKNPMDKKASDRIEIEGSYVGTTRTTCVVTMLNGGHAENALPQAATLTVNCRIFPGVPVGDIEKTLKKVVANKNLEFKLLGEPTESPISELRDDVTSAIKKAVHSRYPELKLIAIMESGGTDGMHFRKAGIPTWAVPGMFMNPDDMFAHGLNERVPIKGFYDALDHWSIIIKELTGK
jgi:acetylornithine deacetylase/succinyl-diaminopimelate desuccinylase-like protein